MSTYEKNSVGNAIVPFERLQVLIAQLQSRAALTRDLRQEIAQALDLLYVMQLEEERKHKRGRDESHITWMAAAVAKTLKEGYGVERKPAVAAATESLIGGTQKDFNRVARAYDKLMSGAPGAPHWLSFRVSDPVVKKAAALLTEGRSKERNK